MKPVTVVIHKELVGLDQSISHLAGMMLDSILLSDQGQWLTEREILVRYHLVDAPEAMGIWLVFFVDIEEDDLMIYRLAFGDHILLRF